MSEGNWSEQYSRRKKRIVITWIAVSVALATVFTAVGLWLWFHRQTNENGAPKNYYVEMTLLGDETVTVEYGQTFKDPGAEALGYEEGIELPAHVFVSVTGDLDLQRLGSYTLTYTAQYHGVTQTAVRQVAVVDTTAPEIRLLTDSKGYTLPGHSYQEEGFHATDLYDGDLTERVERTEKDGVVYYTVTDSSGNRAEAKRQIRYDDPQPPVLTLVGEAACHIFVGEKWIDSGCTAIDNADGDISEKISVSGEVNEAVSGTYVLTYQVSDSYGNTATVERTVVVEDIPLQDGQSGKVIYLTFDDGPWENTDKLLAILNKYQVKATFFVVNTKYISLLKNIAENGHTIGIHSLTHNYEKIYSGEDAYFQDLYAMQDVIFEHTGLRPTVIRFPGGSSNRVSKKYSEGIMTRLVSAVRDKGFQYFDWNVDSDDAGNAKTADEVYRNVIAGVQEKKIPVVLMHDTFSYSIEAVEKIIQWGLRNGYSFQPLTADSPPCQHAFIKN